MAGYELHPPRGPKGRGHSIPAPREQDDLPTHCVNQLGLSCSSTCMQTALWRNTNHSRTFFSHVIIHPYSSSGKSEKSRINGLVKRKSKQNTFVHLHFVHVPSPNTVIPTTICAGFIHGGQKALWRSSMLLACAWFSFSPCVVE